MATWHQQQRPQPLPAAPFVVVNDAPNEPMAYICHDTREGAENCLANIKARNDAYARHSYIVERKA